MSTLAVGAIGVYRRYLSPLKGFRCAHAALHQRGSCSDFGLAVYGRHPFGKATVMMRRRFAECREAYIVLTAVAPVLATASENGGVEHDESEAERKREGNSKADWACNALDAVNCLSVMPDSACAHLGACDCLGGLSI